MTQNIEQKHEERRYRKMTAQDISIIRRFIGVVEGVSISLPEHAQSLIYDYIEVMDAILDREEKGGVQEFVSNSDRL
jgi:hypothetical protein